MEPDLAVKSWSQLEKIMLVAIGLAVVLSSCTQTAVGPFELRVVKDVPLPGHPNRFDYQSQDPAKHRLYIAHMNSNALVVFDTEKDEVVANVEGIGRPAGVRAVTELGRVYVSAARTDELVVSTRRPAPSSPA